ncbi:MAG: prohibitin family protein [Candidatus Zixiibacteriota bacterium]|nr:MAG: prohibitin family protein [candidate division Zixibacteria bacterium]
MSNSRIKGLRLLPLLLVLIFITGIAGCGTQVPSGHRGVFYYKFGDGTEMGKIYPEGFNWHFPWNSMFVFKVQLNEQRENLHVLSSDGASIGLEMTIWFRPLAEKLDSLQVTVGPNYYNIAVAPALRGVSRSVVGKYKPEEIYSSKREAISSEILTGMQTLMTEKFISVDDVIIRNVVLPAKITEAINAKLEADQDAQKMEFVLLKESQEAERKRIEARGIADFQKIVASGVTPSLLTWKGIEATQKLAESPNTKIVIIGRTDNGLPVILDTGK